MYAGYGWRYRIVQGILALLAAFNLIWVGRVQNSAEAQALMENVAPYSGRWRTYYPPRGEIYDRQGRLLAGNRTVYEVGVDLPSVRDAHTLALTLSVNLGLDYAEVYNTLLHPPEGKIYWVAADYVPADKGNLLRNLMDEMENSPSGQSLEGLILRPHLQRSYPEGTLAANVLGFVARDGRGYFGVEEKYDHLLVGVPVTVWEPMDPNRVEELPQIPPAASLVLTLDREIQAAVEEILDEALQEYGAESGVIIVMDPRNGEILAMASTPRLNPNEYWNYASLFPGETPYNRAISQAYEPGSVLKPLTMAGALEAGVVQAGTRFLDLGSIVVGGVPISNWDNRAHGDVDMTTCLQLSLNVCLAWVATQMGNDVFYAAMQRFGLGHTTGIDLAGEVTGRLKLPGDADWRPVELGTNSFGQGVSVTPIQMITAAGAIANEGRMMLPHVLYGIVRDGKQRNFAPQMLGQPISPTTARTLTNMLAASLDSETSLAHVEGYRLAGKTGTAQIPIPGRGYTSDETNASFVGWGPLPDTRFIVYVWLEKPKTSIWGSETAAPVFRRVVERLVVLLGIPPDHVRLSSSRP
jgi:cell division protein FtsI/penicillin-binding protein 2